MSRIKVEVIKTNPAGEQYVEDYYFVDPAAAVAFANFREEHATVINHHGHAVHVSAATNAASVVEEVAAVVEPVVEVAAVVEPVVEVAAVVEPVVEEVAAVVEPVVEVTAVVEPVVEVTVDAEEVVEVVELDAEAPVKKSRKKKEE